MRSKESIGEYLAFLSLKYEVDPDRFFYALNSAWKNQDSTCGSLSIKCRSKLPHKSVLLITKGQKVCAQFSIPNEFLLERNNLIKNLRKAGTLCRHKIKKNKPANLLHIGDLRNGMKQVSLKAKVVEIAKPRLVFTRFGNYASVANALIADETGTIKLCLWNEQIGSISLGDTVQIDNVNVSMFRGERQLRIGKKGTLSIMENLNPLSRVATP